MIYLEALPAQAAILGGGQPDLHPGSRGAKCPRNPTFMNISLSLSIYIYIYIMYTCISASCGL